MSEKFAALAGCGIRDAAAYAHMQLLAKHAGIQHSAWREFKKLSPLQLIALAQEARNAGHDLVAYRSEMREWQYPHMGHEGVWLYHPRGVGQREGTWVVVTDLKAVDLYFEANALTILLPKSWGASTALPPTPLLTPLFERVVRLTPLPAHAHMSFLQEYKGDVMLAWESLSGATRETLEKRATLNKGSGTSVNAYMLEMRAHNAPYFSGNAVQVPDGASRWRLTSSELTVAAVMKKLDCVEGGWYVDPTTWSNPNTESPVTPRKVTISPINLSVTPIKENSPVSNTSPSVVSSILDHEVVNALREGAKDGAAAGAATGMVDALLRTKVGSKLPAILTATPQGRTALSVGLPFATYAVCAIVPDLVPKVDKVKAVSLRAIRGFAVIYFHDLIKELSGYFAELAGIDGE